RRQPPAGSRRVVSQHPLPPDVLCPQHAPLPELEDHQRGTDLLARPQPEMRRLLTACDVQAVRCVPRELGGPLAWPAEHRDKTAAGPLDVEIRKVTVRTSPAAGGDAL